MPRIYRSLLLLVFAFGCFAAGVSAADLSGTARTDTLIWNCRVSGNSFTIDCHLRRTILNAAGNDFAHVSLYESPFEKIGSFEARLYDAQGKEIAHARKKDLLKYCGYGPGYVLYTDNCQYEYEPQFSAFPVTLVEDYQVEGSSLFVLPDMSLTREIPLGYGLINLAFETDHPIRYKSYLLDVPVVETKDRDMTIATWTIHDLPAELEYSSIPSEWIGGSRICVSPSQFKIGEFGCPSVSWKNFGLFYHVMAESRYLPLPAEVHPPASREAGIRLADSMYQETVRQTHYIAVNVKMSGWQTEPAERTQAKGYGDCKGLSTLLISRLRAAGVTAYPCLVLTSDEGAVDTSFVTDEFNHVITMAKVDNDTLWYDATSQTCPPGELPWLDEGVFVLAVTDTGGVVVKVPTLPAQRNTTCRRVEMNVDDSGRSVAKASCRMTGHPGDWLRSSLRGETHENIREFVKSYFAENSTMQADSCTVRQLDSLKVPVEMSARLSSLHSIDRLGSVRYLLPFMLTSRTPYEDLKLETRKMPVRLSYPYAVVDTVVVHSPWTASADSIKLPAQDSASFPGGRVTRRFTRDSSTITGVLTQVFEKTLIPVEDFSKFSAFLAARKKLLDQPIKWFVKAKL